MKIRYAKTFKKMYRKLKTRDRNSVNNALALFRENPFTASLHNHKLHGTMEGARSISAGYDVRIVYMEEDGHDRVRFLRVGSHDKVYQ